MKPWTRHRRGKVTRILCAISTIDQGRSCISRLPAVHPSLRNFFWSRTEFQAPDTEVEKRVDAILGKMTLDEKLTIIGHQ